MNARVTQLQELTAKEISPEDCFLISDVWDKKAGGSVSKQLTVAELVKYMLMQEQRFAHSHES